MKKYNFDVVTIGSAVRDTMFPSPDAFVTTLAKPYKRRVMAFDYGAKYNIETVHVTTGGGACNTAVDFSQLGYKTAVLSSIGNDTDGQSIVKHLKNAGVHTSYIQQIERGHTAFSTIITVPDGSAKEHVIFHHQGVGQVYKLSADELNRVQPKIIYLCSLRSNYWQTTIKRIISYKKKNDVLWVWNPGSVQLEAHTHMHRLLKTVDVLVINKREAKELLCLHKTMSITKLLKDIFMYGPKVVVITDGVQGAHAYDGEKFYFSPIYSKVKTIDTTGVGDAFGSTFTFAYSEYGKDIQKSLDAASINAGYVSGVIGAQNGALTRKELEKKLR